MFTMKWSSIGIIPHNNLVDADGQVDMGRKSSA